jgi:RNA recognition motif-containing protein
VERFLEIFRKYGEILEHRLCVDYDTNKRNGKAWVLYKTSKQAEMALEALDGLILNNRSIEIKRSLKKGFVPADTTNFTTNTRFTGLGGTK